MRKLLWIVMVAGATSYSAQNTTKMMKENIAPYRFASQTIKLKDGELSYMKEGSGKPTLIFLHGLSSNGDAWAKNIEDLKKNYTCIALDLPGYGRSYKEAQEFTPSYFAEVVKEFAEKKKLKNFVLVGHSMGGQASIKFAEKYPEYVSKLILVAPAGIEEFNEMESLTLKNFTTQAYVKNTTDEQIEKNYAINFFKMPEDGEKMIMDRKSIKNSVDFDAHALAIEKSVKGMLDDKVIADIKNITQPVLLLFAENDMLIPNRFLHPTLTIQEVAKKAKSEFKNSQLIMIPESGHFLQYEKPKEVNQAILEFLKSK